MNDPVRRAVIEAMARRASALQGSAGELLMQRVEVLRSEQTAAALPEPAPPRTALAGLSELVDRLGRTPPLPSTRATRSAAAPPATLKAVAAFKGTWSRLRAEQRLRQALQQVPAMAGPLNSSQMVNRALQAMQALSPAYLDAFMAHIDTLLWLEQASGGGDLRPRPAAPAEAGRKAGARGSRKA